MFMMNNDKMLMQLAVLIFIFCLFFFFSLECNCKSGRHMTFVTILHDMSLYDESFN